MEDARSDAAVGAVILCGAGELAFCSGGDQTVRGAGGYVGDDGVARLNVLDLQVQIRRMPKPVVAMVAGYAVGGGHILHMVCDLTIAADNAVFGQTGPKVTLHTIPRPSSLIGAVNDSINIVEGTHTVGHRRLVVLVASLRTASSPCGVAVVRRQCHVIHKAGSVHSLSHPYKPTPSVGQCQA
jgi:hypothetical protein